MRTTALLAIFAAGCGGTISTAFLPPDAGPIPDPRAFASEECAVRSGTRPEGGFWAEGGGVIPQPIAQVWARSRETEFMNWGGVDEFEVAPDGDSAYDATYRVHSFVPVQWRMRWVHVVLEGTADAPRKVVVCFQKVEGTTFIPFWRGVYVLEETAPGVTAFAGRIEIDARQQTEEDTAGDVRRAFERFRGAP